MSVSLGTAADRPVAGIGPRASPVAPDGRRRPARMLPLLILLAGPGPLLPAAADDAPALLRTDSGSITFEIQSQGGLLTDLQLTGTGRNLLAGPDRVRAGAPFGHFLCFDRWGPPSPEDARAGIPFHGEAGWIQWQWQPADPGRIGLQARLPLAGLKVSRSFVPARDHPVLRIETEVRNPADQPRPFNLVEHATLAPFWMAAGTRLTTNAVNGHLHHNGQPVADSTFSWPHARIGDRILDLREPIVFPGNLLASLVTDPGEEWSWAVINDQQSLLGYVWRRVDFPWLNLLWQSTGNTAVARAIEPGTTGLHRPLDEVIRTASLLDTPLFVTINSGQRQTRTLWVFALEGVPPPGRLHAVSVQDHALTIEFQAPRRLIRLPLR